MNKLYLVEQNNNRLIKDRLYDQYIFYFNDRKVCQLNGKDCSHVLAYLDSINNDLTVGLIGTDNKVYDTFVIMSHPLSVADDVAYKLGIETYTLV